MLEMNKPLDAECEGYLGNIMDPTVAEPKLENILVVCNFQEVFLQELLGLPSKREVEFVIELVPRIEPILKAPY